MAVEVGGGEQGSIRPKWLRGLWVADRKSFSISIDSPFLPEVTPQRHLIEEEAVSKSRPPKRVAPKPKRSESSGTPPVLLENKVSCTNAGGAATVLVEATCIRRNSKKSEVSERHMIPLKNLATSAAPPNGAPKTRKSSERRAKIFQRAYSCDLDNSDADAIGEMSARTFRSQDLEMTRVEAENKTTDALLLEFHSSEGSTIASGELKDSERDAGIVCSDEDLHSILSEISHSRRLSAEAKREKMKSNRSLSLDSSFFKLHMKRLQADSPAWLARILNQRDRKEATGPAVATAADGSAEPGGELLRKKSISKKPETAPATISEDTSSAEGDLSSRRESTVSGSDDECSLLLVNNSESIVQGNANPSVVVNDSRTLASRVVWNESNVVDAEVLGHAIEFYLTTATCKRSSVDDCLCQTIHASNIMADVATPGNGDACVPVMSSLKSLFV